jgi:DNA-binding CsgD family transcriptional regulator
MNALIDTVNPLIRVSSRDTHSSIQHSSIASFDEPVVSGNYQSEFLKGVLESMMDGVLVLTCHGKLVYANQGARQVCHQILQDLSQPNFIPQQVWNICEALIDSRALFPDHSLIIEDEISITEVQVIRIRARWLEFDQSIGLCLLVTLEDRSQSTRNIALTEAHRYGLTERETEIWSLRRANFTYKAIAAQLHIAVDTVKKHIKNINAKRQAMTWQ